MAYQPPVEMGHENIAAVLLKYRGWQIGVIGGRKAIQLANQAESSATVAHRNPGPATRHGQDRTARIRSQLSATAPAAFPGH